MGIQRLSASVVSSLRTDVTVTTSAQCVTELVLNSIDAGATAIAVRVDLNNYRIQVIDNGHGVSQSDMLVVGTRYMTSKCHSLQDLQSHLSHFGFRGEALASISDVCGTLTIVSRHESSSATLCKIFIKGVPNKVGKSRQPRACCGTTITVSDFLYNRPVRRARIKSAIDLEDIKTHIECIALINFQISFSLRNDANNEMILQTQRVSDIPTMFGSLFGSPSAKNLMPVKEIMGPFKVEGYISNEAHYLKKFQFIYVNQRLLLKTKLHKLVNSVLSRSTFLKSNNVPHVPISKEINHNVFLAFSPPKRDKHAVFVLNIICPLSEYDITMDPKKTLIEFCDWDSLLNCFENLLRKFVEQEAAVYSENDNVLGGEPTRKLQTVIDEINQLARDEVLQRQITLSSQETINVRAVHSIPVRRDQVSFSPDLSLDIQSTATSNLSSCAKNNSASQFTAIPSSTFTEKPYPPLPCNDSYEKSCTSREDKRDPFMTDEENLPVAKKLSKVQSSNEPKSLAEGLQNSSNYKKKSVKGFITNTLHFVGKSGSMHDDLLYERTHDFKGSAEVSPINALASIKEIRRKKLLQNLNKFSFNPVCEKPLLHKTRRSAVATKTKVDQSCPNLKHEDMRNKSNNFKAVQKLDVKQNNFNATASRESWDMISQLGTTQSSAKTITTLIENEILAKTSEELVSSKQLATKHCEVEPPLDDFKELKKLDKHDSINITTKEEFVKCSGLLHKCHVGLSNTVAKTETRRVLSVEDMIITRYKKGSDDASEIFSSENVEDNYSKITEWVPRTQILSGNRLNAITEDTCVNSHTSKSLKIHYPDATKFSKLSRLSVSEETCCKPTYPSLESVSDSRNQTVRREIVDYDSSPSSSQEESVNDDVSLMNVSSCSNELKRKNGCPGKQEDSKKARTSPGNVSACDQCTLQMLGLQDPNTKSDYIFGSLNRDCHSSLITPKDGWKEHCPPKTDGVFSGTEPVCKTSELLKLSKPQNIIEDSDFSSLEDHHSVSFTVKDNTNQIAQGAADQSTTSPSENLNLDRHFINNTVAEDALPDSRAPASKDSSTASLCAGSDLQDLTFEKNCQALEDNWIKKLNESGRPFYIHKKSGMTSFQEPSEGICNFKFSDRLLFLPKGMSPLLMNKVTNEACTSPNIASFKVKEDLYAVKWAPNEMTDESGSRPLVDKLLSESDRFLAKTFPESQVKNAAMQDNSQSDIKVYNVMHPHSFTKDIFRNLQVLGQLDKKFIVVLASVESTKEVVMLFDQHAVHERIRVESLTEEYRQKDGTSIWRSAPVEPALPLQLSAIEVRILQSYKSKMENLGFSFNVVDLNTINILRVPTCLLLRENREVGRGVSVLRQHLESLIREQVESLLDTRGVGTDHPTIIRNVISSEACRGAVKFGHYLTVADCQAFLHNLSVCNLPFQCAHGRPSLMPIVDLSMLKSKVPRKRPNLQKLKKLQQSI